MNTLRKIDEYLVSSFYTAGALIANGASEAYFAQQDIQSRQEPLDIILTCLFAAAVSIIFAFIRNRRFRVLGVLASFGLWVIRIVMGLFIYGISVIPDNQSLVFWIITILGALSSSVGLLGQYLRHRNHHQEKIATIEPVKIRFVE
jgi:hypothetical protein